MDESEAVKGAYVQIRTTGEKARIYVKGACNYPYPDDDIVHERQFGPNPKRFINSKWVYLLMAGNAYNITMLSLMAPIDALEVVEPFRLYNRYEESYFDYREICTA